MSGEPIIRVVDLHKSFDSTSVLRGLSLDFYPGTTTVILGGSGSGKSVLMKHLVGLLSPDAGQVLIEGEDLSLASAYRRKELRRRFGMVFQMAALFDSLTVYENVVFPLREHMPQLSEANCKERVLGHLQTLGLEASLEKYPAELSGGMRKRVGLARAIVLDPAIVLYDEPTTGLDPVTTHNVDDMIIEAKQQFGVTNIVISHDIVSTFRIADQIAFLSEGKIIEQGPPDEFGQSTNPVVRAFLDTHRVHVAAKNI